MSVKAGGPAGPEPFATVYPKLEPFVEQMSAKSALFTAAVFVLSCVECDGGVGAAYAKIGRLVSHVAAAGTTQRKRGSVSDGVVLRKASARGIRKSSVRRHHAVKQSQMARLVTNQQIARRIKLDRLASKAKSSKRQIAMIGLASFYSGVHETASGERFNGHGLNAAHPSLPFGTRLRVTNVRNGRSVTVRVNDRGPFVRGRIIDVTSAAAEALGMVDAGVVKVTLDFVR
jgi:rare lipoprotein A